jgi:uncharacterized protein DUF5686/carboxypeptidase-like protein
VIKIIGRYFLLVSAILVLMSGASYDTHAQGGIEGYIYDSEGELLPFATIYVKQTETGTTTNIEGKFHLALPPGSYNLIFQYLGYAAQEKIVKIGTNFKQFDIRLQPESLVLRAVEINAKMEDPALTIMRKAIAKSKYHLQQIDSYNARVYTKGSGRLVDSPFFLRKTLAKEGIDSTFTFVSESISEITYERPNTFTEKVISVRSSGEDNGTSPNSYIMGSFYEPTIAEAISPLSPKAFGYYKFEYLGTFTDRQYAVSKIKVTPRSKGDDVFAGTINIVEDYWSIYSLDLTTSKLGIIFNVKQIYNPINDKAWLPVSHQFGVMGKFLGFEFEYDYLATVSNYKVILNPDLEVELTVIDEKVETVLAKQLAAIPIDKATTTQEKLASGKELTRKEFRKLMNAYEKDELAKSDEPNVIENYSFSIDSLAANSDSAFWVSVRPVPLTAREVTGYHKMDSLAIVEREKEEGDTLKSGKRKGFHVQDIILGNSYRFKNKDYLRYYSPLESLNFNTVEGYNFNLRFRYLTNWGKTKRFEILPIVRYSFARGRITGKTALKYTYGRGSLRTGSVTLSGGRFIQQLNDENPIHPIVNTVTTLLFRSNYIKLYESGYLSVLYKGKILDNLGYDVSATWSERTNLPNITNHSWIQNSKEYTSNNPSNVELSDTSFPFYKALVGEVNISYQPWLKYRIRYGRKRAIKSSSPTFTLTYKKGISSAIGDTDFDYLEAGFEHNFKIGVRGRLGLDVSMGKFLNTRSMYFPDFKHFAGNESPFLLGNPVGGYRLLSYYNYSTADQYFSAISHYQFRKFLITQLPLLRFTGVKEIVFLSYLVTPFSGNYIELGYGIDNLFRIFRVEGAAAFRDGRYSGFGIKVGIATSITTEENSVSFGF